ncbi:MAG: N-acetylglucosamine-6-phosphate deacetylase [Rhizobiaceae bacterium]
MSENLLSIVGADVFDGNRLRRGAAVVVDKGHIVAVVSETEAARRGPVHDCGGGVIAPGFVDLQVNGGGGVLFNNRPTVEALKVIADAHASVGTTSILPTLITDRPDVTEAAIAATISAIEIGVAGIVGLHLEGPHLSPARRGAHQVELIRPMQQSDLDVLVAAAAQLPVLKVTVAPESVSESQIATMAAAGIVVSLGHSDATFEACTAAVAAGASCVTHIFNAMSQLVGRMPGLAGAALQHGRLSAGLIADLIHVHPATIALALRAKQGPGEIFLVTDAMSTVGSDQEWLTLNGRRIERRGNRLTLEDGTLAGAHVDFATSIRNLVGSVGLPLERVLAMATSLPAQVIGMTDRLGHIEPGRQADLVHLDDQGRLAAVWRTGESLPVFND